MSTMTAYPVTLQVHYSCKDAAKAAGAKWNSAAKTWEARNPVALHRCRQWAGDTTVTWSKEWLHVPYEQRDHAKAAGARYDVNHRCWYAPLGHASLAEDLDRYRIRWR
jgi:putative DNA primase/helicase